MGHGHNEACSLYPHHPERCNTVDAVHKTFSSLSLIGSFTVGVLILVLKEHKMFVQKMILFMVISAFFDSIAYLIGNIETVDGHGCKFQSFMMQYFDWATLLWVAMITVNMALIVKNKHNAKYLYVYHAVVWLGALFWSVIPFFEDTYGHAGLWCWIKRDFPGYRFGTWFGPLLVVCIAMFVIFLYIAYSVVQATKAEGGASLGTQSLNKRYRDELRPLAFYPLIYVVLNIPTLMYRIEDASHPTNPPNYALTIIAAIFGPSVGAVNAIVFALVNLRSIRNLTWPTVRSQVMLCFGRSEASQITHNIQLEESPYKEAAADTKSFENHEALK